jgi:hypothetical protein
MTWRLKASTDVGEPDGLAGNSKDYLDNYFSRRGGCGHGSARQRKRNHPESNVIPLGNEPLKPSARHRNPGGF